MLVRERILNITNNAYILNMPEDSALLLNYFKTVTKFSQIEDNPDYKMIPQ